MREILVMTSAYAHAYRLSGWRVGLVKSIYYHSVFYLFSHSWYFGNLTRLSAEKLLEDQKPGRFLVRHSEYAKNLESFFLSWR